MNVGQLKMKTIEFRIPMPMSVEDYCRCQIYAVIKGSKNEVDKGSGLHIVKNEPFFDGNSEGRLTQKDLYLAKVLPGWLQSMMDPKFTILTEMSYNCYPLTKTNYSNLALSSLVFSIESNHLPGVVNDDNPLNLPEEILNSRKVVNIDIAVDGKIPDDENITTIRLKTSDLLPIPKDWLRRFTEGEELPFKVMTCVKLVTVSVPYFGLLGSKVENFIMNTLKDQFIIYHRRVVIWLDEWKDLTMEELRNMEYEIFDKINEQFNKTYGKHFAKDTTTLDTIDDTISEADDDNTDNKLNQKKSQDSLFPDSKSTGTYTGYLFKLGGTFFNASWNMRYIVLCKNMLYYYDGKDDNKPKDTLNLTGSKIQWLGEYYGRSFAFAIYPIVHSPIYLSADTEESAKKWILILQLRSEEKVEVEEVTPVERKMVTLPEIGENKDYSTFTMNEKGMTLLSPFHRAVIRLINVEKVKPSFQGIVSSGLNWYDHLLWFLFINFVKYIPLVSKYFQYRYSVILLIWPRLFLYYLIITSLCNLSHLCRKFVKGILPPFNNTPNFNIFTAANDYSISMGNTSETFETLEKVFMDKTFNHISRVNLVKLLLKDKLYSIIRKYAPLPLAFKTISHAIKLDSRTLIVTTQMDTGDFKSFTKEDVEEFFCLSKSSQIDVSELEFSAKRLDFDELIRNAKSAAIDTSVFLTENISSGYELILIRATKNGCRIALYSDFQPTSFPESIFSKQFLAHRVTPSSQFV
ncbi:Phosphatidylinositol transfer protein [Babesia microti strain RI]|uniref:Phosphatidylinositol transfer protein n=1 Tax=Babesia microti (strain RI) TaxID=1133968 RepID=A0A1R4AB22_BABMR|nr:Phosphatidylinositol transfer protein [Babesia microti strain RI]SJK86198.1 Phosphatidylinositol transfer protein [Babesia microti strain RI]|eukprot:XP_021338386.1 Phosphatidylinositol transfer protein [Babesia microti strain RI]